MTGKDVCFGADLHVYAFEGILGWYILACAFTDQSLSLQLDVTQTLLDL